MSTDDPDVVSMDVFITTSRQEVLLQLRDDQPDIRWPAHWVLPAGTASPASPHHQAAVRERREETGLHVPGLCPFHPVPTETDLRGPRRRAFHARVDVDPAELVLGEGQELRLVPFAEAQRMKRPPALKGYLRRPEARLTAGRTPSGPWSTTSTATSRPIGPGSACRCCTSR
ncbi:NUDIX domain-containing protein [Kitasatospora aureofaciens]|uniref:NUDIX domain-containing protein n=1 Tax=Kitasatospora aureofaciens TaxID=1894 RepID=UPI0037CA0CCD